MAAWCRTEPEDYGRLDLRAHTLLADVPLHDVWRVDLPGGGAGRTLADVRPLMSVEGFTAAHPLVRALFGLRALLGRLFGWDAPPPSGNASFLHRLDEEDRSRSLVAPGAPDGPFRVLYVRPFEAVSEVRNATVHAFSVLVLRPRPGGYRLFWAIHVAPVGRITRLYLALIDPFRRFLVYPAILRHVHGAWSTRNVAATDP